MIQSFQEFLKLLYYKKKKLLIINIHNIISKIILLLNKNIIEIINIINIKK